MTSFYGDLVTPMYFGDITLSESFSVSLGANVSTESPFIATAIIAQYTDEGFAIAADGLRKNIVTGEDVCTNVQKIFPIEERQNRRVLAYALAGAVDIPDASGVSIFNFALEVSTAARKVADTRTVDLPSYAMQLAGMVNERLLLERQSGKISQYPTVPGYPGLIARAAFLGYYKDLGCLAQLIFHHDNQILCSPSLTKMEVGPTDFEVFSGSEFINRMIFKSKDLKFSRYRTPSVKKRMPVSKLSEAKELVRNYIQACIDNRKRDAECSTIGGHIHSATITPAEGFKWVEGFEPVR